MDPIRRNDSGAAVLDVQRRLVTAGYLAEEAITGTFDAKTANAVAQLCVACGIDPRQEVDELVWNKLVDESFELGDRNLFCAFHSSMVAMCVSSGGIVCFRVFVW